MNVFCFVRAVKEDGWIERVATFCALAMRLDVKRVVNPGSSARLAFIAVQGALFALKIVGAKRQL